MMSESSAAGDAPSETRSQLEQREAWYRAKSLRSILELKKALKLREAEVEERRQELETRDTTIYEIRNELLELRPQLEARDTIIYDTRNEVLELRPKIEERDTTIHLLHQEARALRAELNERARQLEELVHLLRTVDDDRQQIRKLAARRPPWPESWFRSPKPLPPRLEVLPHRPFIPAPHRPLTYFLHTPPYRLYPAESVTLRGWCFDPAGGVITNIRARVDDQLFEGITHLPEPEVVQHYGLSPQAPPPGFSVALQVDSGRHQLALEALIKGQGWASFLTVPVWGPASR